MIPLEPTHSLNYFFAVTSDGDIAIKDLSQPRRGFLRIAWPFKAGINPNHPITQSPKQPVHDPTVPDPSWKGYDKEKSLAQARHQARFNAYLLEKYRARFCNQYHLSYDQMKLIIQESRLKNWPMPLPPEE